MNGNIVGEEFDEFVRDQIKIRQGNQFGGYNSPRNGDQLQYLTNRNAWIKLASSVDILEGNIATPLTGSDEGFNLITRGSFTAGAGGGINIGNTTTRSSQSLTGPLPGLTNVKLINYKSDKLRNIKIENPEKYGGSKLAESAILFNTLSSYTNSTSPLNSTRAGISNTNTLWNDDFAYGIGGTDFGIQPPPGIISATIDSLNRGSIRKANIILKAHNKFQFDIIELLYLRLGFTMILEWGWDKFLDDEGVLQPTGNTIIEEKWFTSKGISQLEMLGHIQDMRGKYHGNYDGFFGKVSNFTWSFNPDGSYDISIDLITLGDVIESLKVNTFSKQSFTTEADITKIHQKFKLDNTNIAKASTLNSIGYFLYKKIEELNGNNSNAELVASSSDGSLLVYKDLISKSTSYVKLIPKDDSAVTDQYYIKLGEFLSQLENLVIPVIKNSSEAPLPQICISHILEENLISYFPNQIPLDPKICIFKPSLNSYGDIRGITLPKYFNDLDEYIYTDDESKNKTCGLLMNLYINFEFISGLLVANGGPDQSLSLYKFLQDLCNGINSALGGINKLEPIIKNDYIVTIIDQTFSADMPIEVDLEVYGYNTDSKISNFVKDIKFVSKITPQLASMVSIGATAAGSSTSEIDGTAFSKFSEGLVDRFSKEILEPQGLSTLGNTSAVKEEDYYKKEFNSFPRLNNFISRTFQRIFQTGRWGRNEKSRENDRDIRKVNIPYYQGIYGDFMDFDKFYILASEIRKKREEAGFYKEDEIKNLINKNYAVYLANAFGGTVEDIKIEELELVETGDVLLKGKKVYKRELVATSIKFTIPRYLQFNDTFISQGKGAYQNYINSLNNTIYTTNNTPSSEIGFIPLSFELTLDGISGIKIYNKLNINSRFLPSNYPESLNFIITKVNHNVSNNSWETSLSTISMPITKPYKFEPIPSQDNTERNTGSGLGNASNNITGTLVPQPGQSGKLEPLKSIAAKYESGGKGYGAANTGTTEGCQFFSTTNVENMEFGELKRLMKLPGGAGCNRARVFAAGKYQIIPLTLFGGGDLTGGLWKQLGLTDTDKYTPEIQERMFLQMILNRSALGDYLTAKNEGTITQLSNAIQQLSQLFASMPTIKDEKGNIVGNVELGTGNNPYYLGALNNKLKAVSVRQMAKIMIQSRINYSGPTIIPFKSAVPNYIPSYYTSPI